MNQLGDAQLRTWTLRLTALLAADTEDQLAWLGERELETDAMVEEVELLCRVAEGLTRHGVLEPERLDGLRAIGRRLGRIDAARRAGHWGDALTTDPAWAEVRPLARRFLLATLGDWRQPLPSPVSSRAGGP